MGREIKTITLVKARTTNCIVYSIKIYRNIIVVTLQYIRDLSHGVVYNVDIYRIFTHSQHDV